MNHGTEPGALRAAAAVPRAPGMRGSLVGLSLAMLLSSLGTSSANVALPSLARAFDASFQAVQWVVVAYLLAITTSIVAFGRLGDLIGPRRLLLAGIAVFGAASVVSGVAPALWILIAARTAQGLGAAVMMALAVALVGAIAPKERTGSAMGLLGTTSAIGTALGPSLGGALIGLLGWRSIFLVNVPLALVGMAVLYRYLPPDPTTPARRIAFDNQGTAILCVTLAAYALAMTFGRGHFGLFNAALLGAAVVGLLAFLRTERNAPAPLVRLGLLRDRAMGASLGANLLVSAVLMATLVVGPFYLSTALGLGPATVGLVMSAGPVVSALTGIPAGRIVDRVGSRRTTLIGLGGVAAGALLLSLAPETLGIPGYVVPIMIVTPGYALFQASNNTSVMQNVGPGERGVVAGTLSLSRNLGLVSGTCVLGAVFAAAAHATDITGARPEAIASATRLTFAVASVLGLVALTWVAAAFRRRVSAAE